VNELGELHELFAASVGAAAALIGLLFVAISIAPEKVFGDQADADRRADAQRAFTALVNVFFVSLAALMPHSALRVIEVVAALAIVQIARAVLARVRLDGGLKNWRHLGLISLCIYIFELIAAQAVVTRAVSPDKLVYFVLGLYAYALGTSWSLLGAKAAAKKA
jgi:hypothetical protein